MASRCLVISGLVFLILFISVSGAYAQQAPSFTITAEDGSNTIKGNHGDIVTVVLKGTTPGYNWGAVQVDFTQGVQEVISVEEYYRGWYDGMGLWWTTASADPARGGGGTLYYYNHDHSQAQIGPISYNDYLSEGTVDAASWDCEGFVYGYNPGPSASIDGTTIRFYYSGYLGPDAPGIKIQVKLNGTGPIMADIFNHTKFLFSWFPYDWENSQYDVGVNLIPRQNYQAVHNEDYLANIWVGYKGPETAKVGEKFSFTIYAQLLIGSGNLAYDINIAQPDGTVVDIASGIALDRYEGTDFTPTQTGEHTVQVSATDLSGHGNGSSVMTEASVNVVSSIAHTLGTKDPCDTTEARESGGSTIDYAGGNLNLDIEATRLIPNSRLPVNLTLYYNSLDDIVTGPLGPNWTHTFNQSVITNTDGTVSYRMGDGKRFIYTPTDTAGIFISLPQYGDYSIISETATGYLLIKRDRVTYTFSAEPAGSGGNTIYRLLKIRNRDCERVTCQYTGDNLTEITLANNNQKILLAYTDNLLTQITDPLNNQTVLSYTATGQLETVSKNSGEWKWRFEYLPDTNLISAATNPENIRTQYQYQTGTNKIISIIDTNNNTWGFSYDVENSVVTITDRAGKTTTAKYNLALDTWLERTDNLGNRAVNVFDSSRNLLSQTRPGGAVTRYTYDALGRILTVTDPLSCTTTYRYEHPNPANYYLPTMITDARNISTLLWYDDNGNLITRIEALGAPAEQRTDYEYYTFCRVKKETRDPGGLNLVTEYKYDANGYLTERITDPAGLNIVYKTDYDVLGQVIRTYCPRSMQPNFEYTYDYRGNQTSIRTYTAPGVSYLTALEYNLMNNLVRRTEDVGGLNIVTEYQYDNLGRLVLTVLDPAGLNIRTQNEYDNTGRLTRTIDPEGAETLYEYYGNGWLKETRRQLTSSLYAITSYEYDANGNRTRITDPEGHITSYTYNIKDQIETMTDAEGNVTRYEYENCGCCGAAWVTDPRGNTTYTKYDELKRVKYVRTPQDNITTAYVYDKAGRLTQTIGPWYDTNQNGATDDTDLADIRYTEYDKDDRIIKTWVNSHPATMYAYDKAGNVTRIIDPEGAVTEHQYNRCRHLVKTTVDPSGLNECTFYKYDTIGRQIEVTAGYGTPLATTTYSDYDNANRLIRQYTADPLYATTYQYNKRGQQTSVTDAESRMTQYFYDLSGRLIRTTDARGYYTDYEYNKDGLRTQLTYYRNGLPVDTLYTYYRNHLLWTTDLPGFAGRNVTTNVYDGNGNLVSKTDAKGQEIVYTYDKNNRMTGKQADQLTTYTYDASSNLLTTLDANTDTINEYDDLSRLTKVTDRKYTPAKVIEYTYWDDGTRKTMLEPEGALVEYGYDKAKRLLSVKRNNVTEATYQYNRLGQRVKLTNGSNAYTEYQYNHPLRWLTQISNRKSNGSIISSFAYTHDKVGNRKTMQIQSGQSVESVVYDYDPTYQLINEQRTGSASYQLAWTYDEVGNRLNQTKDGAVTSYTYNDANQLISEISGGVTTSYEYDANGNQIVKRSPLLSILRGRFGIERLPGRGPWRGLIGRHLIPKKGGETDEAEDTDEEEDDSELAELDRAGITQAQAPQIEIAWRYDYDHENRQVKITRELLVNGQVRWSREVGEYKYNAAGSRIEKKVFGRRNRPVTTRYILDGANIIADYTLQSGIYNLTASYLTPFLDQNLLMTRASMPYYYMVDGLGSVRNIIDQRQRVRNRYDYYAFGETLSQVEGVSNRYRFTSREWDSESANYYYRARYYTPITGRFIARDPIEYEGGINFYTYVGNNSVNKIDPSGTGFWDYLRRYNACVDRCLKFWYVNEICWVGGGTGMCRLHWTKGLPARVLSRLTALAGGYCIGVLIGCEAACLGNPDLYQ
ncbi:MAG: RHS repeat-associated core domain-containing protein [Planctomycetota bacterium]